MNERKKVLIVDDDRGLRETLIQLLSRWNYDAVGASSGEEALDLLRKARFDLVVTDVMMSGMDGFGLLHQIKRMDPSLPVVIMTGSGDIRGAVRAIEEGAADYLTKPFPNLFLKETIEKALRHQIFAEKDLPETSEGNAWDLVTQDPTMKKILAMVKQVAATKAHLLIQGETGTGKERIARYLHAHSPNQKKSFFAINCAAIPKDLLESELFGHEKGAFTGAHERKIGKFEAAGEGTLFLDEIGEMAQDLQAKLLRVLQEKEYCRLGGNDGISVKAHVIAATNRNLKDLVAEGRFRSDLYYRLAVVPVQVPPLRERTEDIPLLVSLFLARYEKEHGLKNLRIETAAVDRLRRYDWPGNVRELDNTLLRAAITCREGLIREDHLVIDEDSTMSRERPDRISTLDEVEKQKILDALNAHDGNRTHTAKALGISLSTLKNKLRRYKMSE